MSLKLILLPGWVEEAVKASGSSMNVLLDTTSLSSILSKEDVAFYTAINLYGKSRIIERIDSLRHLAGSFKMGVVKDNIHDNSFMPGLIDPETISVADMVARPEHRIYDSKKTLMTIPGHVTYTYLYEIFPIHDEYMGLRVFEETIDNMDERHARLLLCVDNAIGRLHTYLSFEQICLLPIFDKFVELSS